MSRLKFYCSYFILLLIKIENLKVLEIFHILNEKGAKALSQLDILSNNHPKNSLIVTRNLCLFSLSKNLFFKFSETYIKKFIKFQGFQLCAYFFSSFVVVELLAVF